MEPNAHYKTMELDPGCEVRRYPTASTLHLLTRRRPSSPQADERKAYKRLAAIIHPDKNPELGRGPFQALQAAYEVLGDPERRQAYDEWEGRAGGRPAGGDTAGGPAAGPTYSHDGRYPVFGAGHAILQTDEFARSSWSSPYARREPSGAGAAVTGSIPTRMEYRGRLEAVWTGGK